MADKNEGTRRALVLCLLPAKADTFHYRKKEPANPKS